MKDEIHKSCKIKSTPHQLVSDKDGYKYSVNGIIETNGQGFTANVMVENLNIPDNEWKHLTEDDADAIFIKNSKKFIDSKLS